MTSPERKAAERILRKIFRLPDKNLDDFDITGIPTIIAEEHAPMRAMMERMSILLEANHKAIAMYMRIAVGTCRCKMCAGTSEVLSDYAAMKKEWEAEDVLNTTKA